MSYTRKVLPPKSGETGTQRCIAPYRPFFP